MLGGVPWFYVLVRRFITLQSIGEGYLEEGPMPVLW